MEEETVGVTDVDVAGNGAAPGSFEARMQERRRQREQRSTELFTPPGFEDLFRVELRVVGYRRLADISLRHQRQADEGMQALYIAADQLLEATVAFHMLTDDGRLEPIEDGTWVTVARAFDPNLDQTTRPRVALIRLLGDGMGVIRLHADWNEWNTSGNAKVDRELAEDFPET